MICASDFGKVAEVGLICMCFDVFSVGFMSVCVVVLSL